MPLITEKFIVPVPYRGHTPLHVAVKRYTSSTTPPSSRGVTLVLTHGVTFHKESWEPVLSDLFEMKADISGTFHVREAWSVDAPNHGESAALNDQILQSGKPITFRDYAGAVMAFMESGLIDVRHHRLVALSHSAGSGPLIWAADAWFRKYRYFPFRSMILLEPPLISTDLDAKYNHFNSMLAAKALKRRQIWSSHKEAMHWFNKQQKSWDPQCRELFTKYGLRQTPAGVTLSCNGVQEAACYSVSEQDQVLQVLSNICPRLPVHTIFSEFVDLSPSHTIRENIVDPTQGRRMASVTWMPGVGHFAPLENPSIAAQAVFHCLYLSQKVPVQSQRSNPRSSFTDARL